MDGILVAQRECVQCYQATYFQMTEMANALLPLWKQKVMNTPSSSQLYLETLDLEPGPKCRLPLGLSVGSFPVSGGLVAE